MYVNEALRLHLLLRLLHKCEWNMIWDVKYDDDDDDDDDDMWENLIVMRYYEKEQSNLLGELFLSTKIEVWNDIDWTLFFL